MPEEPENVYADHEVTIPISGNSRRELRDKMINEFLKEDGGYVKDDKKYVQAYRYYVENLSNGKRVFLQRPAYLNKGMDFQVCVEDLLKYKNGNDKPPSHKDLLDDLKLKKSESSQKFSELIALINKVWECQEPQEILRGNKLTFAKGFTVETLLKMLKWLFIEQDMTYWSYDGRDMLKREIDKL